MEDLRTQIGKEVLVRGMPIRFGVNRTATIHYLNFTEDYKQSLSLVFFIEDDPEAFSEESLRKMLDNEVEVRGRVDEFRGDLQLRVRERSQITVRKQAQ